MKIVETILPKGKILQITELKDGTYKVVQNIEEVVETKSMDTILVLIQASKLSLDDDFMKFNPKKDGAKAFKKALSEVIKKGVKDFYRPIIDPSFTEDEKTICFEMGKKPAVGKSDDWWKKIAKEFYPERGSRLGTKSEYIAFLGVLIKTLVSNGLSKAKAWNAVCINSAELGNYWNSKDAKHDFEPTGSRCICNFYDLANSYKILDDDVENDGYWLVGGTYCSNSSDFPLAILNHYTFHFTNYYISTGWLVFET